MGITSQLAAVPASILGASGVNTMEMASAYGTLATGGIYNKPTCITKIVERASGTVLLESQPTATVALTPEVAYAANKVMRSNVTNGYAVNGGIPGYNVCGKTGTTDEARDSWFIGYIPQMTMSVWSGCRQERPGNEMYSYSVCSPLWADIMKQIIGYYDFPATNYPTAKDPVYDPKATFMTLEEQAAAAAEEERLKKEKEEAESSSSSSSSGAASSSGGSSAGGSGSTGNGTGAGSGGSGTGTGTGGSGTGDTGSGGSSTDTGTGGSGTGDATGTGGASTGGTGT
jgi:penicillin-binding protein 1A